MLVCMNFCKDCFFDKVICKVYERIYDIWNYDKCLCEFCYEKIKNGDVIICICLCILFFILYVYKKFGKGVLIFIEVFNDGNDFLD